MPHEVTSESVPTSWLVNACLMFAEALRSAISAQTLALALLGTLLVSSGWKLAGAGFLPPRSEHNLAGHAAMVEFHGYAARWPGARGRVEGLAALYGRWILRGPSSDVRVDTASDDTFTSEQLENTSSGAAPIDPVFGVAYRMVEPFRQLFRPQSSWRSLGYFLTGGVWSLAVWALLGGAITRSAVMRLGRQQRIGMRAALSFARQNWLAYFTAPALPLVSVVMIGLPLVVVGWLARLDIGVFVAGLLWGLVALAGLLMALLALGLMFGWPLMWGTISTEKSDAFDAISRSYAYTFQRPLHFLFCGAVAAVLGTFGWLVAWGFSELVLGLSYWGVSWGSGFARLRELQAAIAGAPSDGQWPTSLWFGTGSIHLVVGLVRAVASAFSLSFFWCATAAAYLLLRQATDQTEMDEIVGADRDDDFDFGLPELTPDEAGVPGVNPVEEEPTQAASDS